MNLFINKNPDLIKFVTMPDGLQHIQVDVLNIGDKCDVYCRLKDGRDLMHLKMLRDVMPTQRMTLHLLYNSAGRMDRAIHSCSPRTLDIVAKEINALYFDKVIEYMPHNPDYSDTIFRGYHYHEMQAFYEKAYNAYNLHVNPCFFDSDPLVCYPDRGARDRFVDMQWKEIFFCSKERELSTGKLKGFSIVGNSSVVNGRNVFIMDDLCDGGGTYIGLSQLFRTHGAKSVGLAVTHGVFSKGLPLNGIDWVASTNTFNDVSDMPKVDYMHLAY